MSSGFPQVAGRQRPQPFLSRSPWSWPPGVATLFADTPPVRPTAGSWRRRFRFASSTSLMNAMKTRAKLHTTTIAMLALLLGFFLAVPNASAQINEEPPAPPEQAVDPEVAPEAAGAPADAPPQEVSGAANLVTVLEADGDYTIF